MNQEVVLEQQRKKSRVQYNLNFPVPEVRSSFDRDIKIMRSFVTASDFGQRFVGRKEVASFSNINEQIVGGVLTFFSKIGLAEKEGHNYKPNLELISFENELKYETEEVAGKALKPIILNTWFGDMAIKIFRAEGKALSNEELFKRLGKMAGADPDYHKSAINHLIEYLKFSTLITYNEENCLYSINMDVNECSIDTPTGTTTELPQTNASSLSDTDEKSEVLTTAPSIKFPQIKTTSQNISININLDISNSTDPGQIREVIRVILEEVKA